MERNIIKMPKRPILKKRGVMIAIIVALCAAACVLIVHFTGSNPVSNAVRTVFSPFQNGLSYIAAKVDGVISFVWEADSYKKQNEELVAKVNELTAANRDAESYRRENERLQSLLELKNSITDYSTVAASVIAYSTNNWYDTLEINKGKNASIAVGNSVVTSEGVVGRVIAVGENWATVSSVINTGSATGIRVPRTGEIGVVEGDGELCMQGLCRVSFIGNESGLIVGDLLETSGSGGIYPEGFVVGRITEVEADNTGRIKNALVQPAVDFAQLREVLVINGMAR